MVIAGGVALLRRVVTLVEELSRLKVPPRLIVTPVVALLPFPLITRVPWFIVVAPVFVLTPVQVTVPLVFLVTAIAPARTALIVPFSNV
jgi:hypothetical protein